MPVHIGELKSKHPRSVDAFCDRNGICRASFYNLVKRGQAPDLLKIGARTTITEQAEEEWRQRMTRPAKAA